MAVDNAIPANAIMLVDGTCPSGWITDDTMAGRFLVTAPPGHYPAMHGNVRGSRMTKQSMDMSSTSQCPGESEPVWVGVPTSRYARMCAVHFTAVMHEESAIPTPMAIVTACVRSRV